MSKRDHEKTSKLEKSVEQFVLEAEAENEQQKKEIESLKQKYEGCSGQTKPSSIGHYNL